MNTVFSSMSRICLVPLSFEMTLNSKHRTEKLNLKTKDTETRKTKTQKD